MSMIHSYATSLLLHLLVVSFVIRRSFGHFSCSRLFFRWNVFALRPVQESLTVVLYLHILSHYTIFCFSVFVFYII
ncbi:hypothetical protein V1504DRAFT_14183 [Lipomyces starkeyi]